MAGSRPIPDTDGGKAVAEPRALHTELDYLTGDSLRNTIAVETSAEFIPAYARSLSRRSRRWGVGGLER